MPLWVPRPVRKHPAVSAIVLFALVTLPGAVDAWWSLFEKWNQIEGDGLMPSLVEWLSLVSGPVSLAAIIYIALATRRKKSPPPDGVEATAAQAEESKEGPYINVPLAAPEITSPSTEIKFEKMPPVLQVTPFIKTGTTPEKDLQTGEPQRQRDSKSLRRWSACLQIPSFQFWVLRPKLGF